MKSSKTTAPPKSGAGKTTPPARKRADWEAVERDYRTGRFTLRELEAKHGPNNATIGRRAEREGWTKDLSDAIRQATNAKVIAATVQQECSSAQQSAATTVLAAAELNKQIILGHRTALRELGEKAETARDTLMTLANSVADVREAATVMSALESYGRIVKLRVEKEREAFGINDTSQSPEKPAAQDWASKSAEEGMAAYLKLVHGQ